MAPGHLGGGASLLLYFKGITDDFHDIDLMISQKDVPVVCQILDRMGNLQESVPLPLYKT